MAERKPDPAGILTFRLQAHRAAACGLYATNGEIACLSY